MSDDLNYVKFFIVDDEDCIWQIPYLPGIAPLIPGPVKGLRLPVCLLLLLKCLDL